MALAEERKESCESKIAAEPESVERKFRDVGFACGVLERFILLVRLEHRAKNFGRLSIDSDLS